MEEVKNGKDRIIVLFSGGLDSTTLLKCIIDNNPKSEVIALSVSYGQRHSIELKKAETLAKTFNVLFKTINLADQNIFTGIDGNKPMLMDEKQSLVHESYRDSLLKDNIVKTYVPFRNGIMLSVAAAFAIASGAPVVFYGAHLDDAEAAYPDCSEDFFDMMDAAVQEGTGQHVFLQAPFIKRTKSEILRVAIEHEVPLQLTHSCYAGHEKACGKCGTCINRIEAFKANGIIDPVDYQVEPDWPTDSISYAQALKRQKTQ